ncbi:MAG: DUF3037 domain-containing protein [Thermomicrobiales bacterium]|nr:DUF3037 domain-containing protein [Thermomicrobiales bacterium]
MSSVPYLYSVLRLVPDIERAEAINVGLVVFCRPQRFLQLRWEIDAKRIAAFALPVPLDLVRSQLESHTLIAAADAAGGPVAALDIGERFHWLTNISNTMIQPGPVHPGLTEDVTLTFERLYDRLVAPNRVE